MIRNLLAFFLSLSILIGCATSSVFSQQEDVAKLIAAVPTDFKTILTTDDSRYSAAFAATQTAVLAISEYDDDKIAAIENYQIAFDAYCYLCALACKKQIFTDTIHADNWQNALLDFLEIAEQLEDTISLIDELAYYTSEIQNSDDAYIDNYGNLQSKQLMESSMLLARRLSGYFINLSTQDQSKVLAVIFGMLLDELPDDLNADNLLLFADNLLSLQAIFNDEYITEEKRNYLKDEDIQRYNQYMASLYTIQNEHQAELITQAEEAILIHCDIASVVGISRAKAAIISATDYKDVRRLIYGLSALYDYTVFNQIYNFGLYLEYQRVLFTGDYGDNGDYGDIDYTISGDLNYDFFVDASDALIVLQIAVGKQQANHMQLNSGDVNGDGDLNAADALLILQYAVEKIYSFPVDEMIV